MGSDEDCQVTQDEVSARIGESMGRMVGHGHVGPDVTSGY